MPTKIEWADEVWNPVTGCAKVSQGCKNCYAERIAERFWRKDHLEEVHVQDINNNDVVVEQWVPRKFTDVRCHTERLGIPLHWRKPRRIFVNSMSDLFHESVPDEFIDQVFETMHLAYWHTFMILTKRPYRMRAYINSRYSDVPSAGALVLPNVWLGVSVENQSAANDRIPVLQATNAVVRFLSLEPLLSEIDLAVATGHAEGTGIIPFGFSWLKSSEIHWVVTGGESGPHARPAHPDWFRDIRDQCQAARVPFFFKQWGEWFPTRPFDKKTAGDYKSNEWNGGVCSWKVGKKAADRLLDGREWSEYPEFHSFAAV
jgi:protein gp37